jgi:hypothetical protein
MRYQMTEMSDRERVLMAIAVETAGTVHDEMHRLKGGWQLRFTFDRPAPQFIPMEMAESIGMPMQPGDIVRCKTNPNHRWGIAELVEKRGHSDFLLREIGGTGLCNMGNESLDVLRFMAPQHLYTGTKYRIYQWVTRKAFSERYNPDADYYKRFGGMEFDGDTLTVWCRSHIWAMEKKGEDGTTLHVQPKKFTMQWSDKTKLKDIVGAMREQGFASDFEYSPQEPTDGQVGYAKITKDELLKVLQNN